MSGIKFCNFENTIIKSSLLCIIIVFISNIVSAQIALPAYKDTEFSTTYRHRLSLFRLLPIERNDIIFLGNSITAGNEWSELFRDGKIKNRGISGDITAGVLHRLPGIIQQKPAKIFLLIGINDLSRGISTDSILRNIFLAADYIHQESPATRLYIQSILPVNKQLNLYTNHTDKKDSILIINRQLDANATEHHFVFINLYPHFTNAEAALDTALTDDGLHLRGEGYMRWYHCIYPYVYGLQDKPALIPLPQHIRWDTGLFPLFRCNSISINDSLLYPLALCLNKTIPNVQIEINAKSTFSNTRYSINLHLDKSNGALSDEEAYTLTVSDQKVIVSAGTAHGIFNGLQTLHQLMRDGTYIDACTISDEPAFSWRGYMIDVGRNYMSMDLLRQQIDVMAQYKLNVFHFHATEDIAWRIAIRQYPQLTAPATMLRDKGMYYTETEIRDLIAYCKERFITFVPEIDMPGHSAAFRRAMGVDMQSDSGMYILRNILKEFCSTYDLPYFHIGGDEVHIVNKQFIPAMTQLLEGLGKKVIGWQPGANFTSGTIRQLWMDDAARISQEPNIRVIDSRHLYLNHMDPLESVITIFNRRIGDTDHEDSTVMGATLCMWPDRAVATDKDILRMNPVYPGMLAFAERSWRGGGHPGWVSGIDTSYQAEFTEFENRLLDHKQQYFKEKAFPYVRQSNYKWTLYGPYQNKGDVNRKFLIEYPTIRESSPAPAGQAMGGTIILRHWWAPLIKGTLEHPEENTTCYATTRIWSDEAKDGKFWIGFNDISRSPATDSPPFGAWDDKGSAVWVNSQLIPPPHWLRPGQKGNSAIPLTDEGYSYRTPTIIHLKKGWNNVLIKAPIAGFQGVDWQNPVKWMFTFAEVQ